jgi:hypothetical protein
MNLFKQLPAGRRNESSGEESSERKAAGVSFGTGAPWAWGCHAYKYNGKGMACQIRLAFAFGVKRLL